MDFIRLSVPSKTFLLGEYVALRGGPAILLATHPRFQLNARPAEKISISGIHPNSPAGQLIHAEMGFYQHYRLQFIDPYHGLGGFGASTAQFLLVQALKHYREGKKLSEKEGLDAYLKLAWKGVGIPPSGADLIAQLWGGVCFFHKNAQQTQVFPWPFADINYGLIHTGAKLATHSHLEAVTLGEMSDLEKITQAGFESLKKKDSAGFIEAILAYAHSLKMRQLVSEHTQSLLNCLSSHATILASKGCGAMGADVVLILYNKNKEKEIIELVKEKNLNLIVYGNKVEQGLNVAWVSEANPGSL